MLSLCWEAEMSVCLGLSGHPQGLTNHNTGHRNRPHLKNRGGKHMMNDGLGCQLAFTPTYTRTATYTYMYVHTQANTHMLKNKSSIKPIMPNL